jgi:hypothetical protein
MVAPVSDETGLAHQRDPLRLAKARFSERPVHETWSTVSDHCGHCPVQASDDQPVMPRIAHHEPVSAGIDRQLTGERERSLWAFQQREQREGLARRHSRAREQTSDCSHQTLGGDLTLVNTEKIPVRTQEHQGRPGADRVAAPNLEGWIVHDWMRDLFAENSLTDILRFTFVGKLG